MPYARLRLIFRTTIIAGMLFSLVSFVAAQTAVSPAASDSKDSASMTASDFVTNGVPHAKVLYKEGSVLVWPPGASIFHVLGDDEPIAANSIISTGPTGVLDFATGPGMATRMEPDTIVTVTGLPPMQTQTSPSATNPETSRLKLKNGTLFSALGREDGGQLDYEVSTPNGVAGARGTMFSTTATAGNTEVSMLHGTVNFKTPDQQTSQITAGQSQQISSTGGGKYQFKKPHALNPSNSDAFFKNAGGLLDHASGYGVVRHGLGPDVAHTLQKQGYKLPAGTQTHFENSAKVRYQKPSASSGANHPANRATTARTPGKVEPSTNSTNRSWGNSNETHRTNTANQPPDKERQTRRDRNGAENDRNKDTGQ